MQADKDIDQHIKERSVRYIYHKLLYGNILAFYEHITDELVYEVDIISLIDKKAGRASFDVLKESILSGVVRQVFNDFDVFI